MKIPTEINLQMWNCGLKINNLNDCSFRIFQLRSVRVSMELRLRGSTFQGIELSNLDAPWIDADFQTIRKLPYKNKFLGVDAKSYLELAKMYSSMRMQSESIFLLVKAKSADSFQARNKFTNDFKKETDWWARFCIRINIAGNYLNDILLNRFFRRFYSPWAIFISGLSFYAIFTLIYIHEVFLVSGCKKSLDLAEASYYSLITFCTVGYGDITPIDSMRFVAGLEGLIGIIFAAFFSLTLARRFSL